jgi:hypothetical protein
MLSLLSAYYEFFFSGLMLTAGKKIGHKKVAVRAMVFAVPPFPTWASAPMACASSPLSA